MNSVIARIGATATALATTGLLLAPATMAEDSGTGGSNTCTITDNGAFSHNRCRIKVKNSSKIKQINNNTIKNNVKIKSNTGGNHASFNTGGDVTITSGDSSVTVTITNTTGGNTINP